MQAFAESDADGEERDSLREARGGAAAPPASPPPVRSASLSTPRAGDDDAEDEDEDDASGDVRQRRSGPRVDGWIRFPSLHGEREHANMADVMRSNRKPDEFLVFEKIDGCNVSVMISAKTALMWFSRNLCLDGERADFHNVPEMGAEIEPGLRAIHAELVARRGAAAAAPNERLADTVCLYGEVYGKYFPDATMNMVGAAAVQTRVCYSSRAHVRFFDAVFCDTKTWVDRATFEAVVPSEMRLTSLHAGTFNECVGWCAANLDRRTDYSDAGHQGLKQGVEGFVISHVSSWPKAKYRTPEFLEAPTAAQLQWLEFLTYNLFLNALSKVPHAEKLVGKDIPVLIELVREDVCDELVKDGAGPEALAAVKKYVIVARVKEWMQRFNEERGVA